MKKIFVLDSNIPLLDPNCLENFEDNDIVLSPTMIKELDNKKTRVDEIGKNARHFTDQLDKLEELGDIYEGVQLNSGGILKVETNYKSILGEIQDIFGDIDNDDRIVSVAIGLHRKYIAKKEEYEKQLEEVKTEEDKNFILRKISELKPVILVSRDKNVRLRAKKFKVPSEKYEADKLKNVDEIYKGWDAVPVRDSILSDYYQKQPKGDHEHHNIPFDNPILMATIKELGLELQPNQYIVLVPESSWTNSEEELEELADQIDTPVLKYDPIRKRLVYLLTFRKYLQEYKIFPRNLHQRILIDMLFDRNTKQKSIIGLAGSGKTLLVLLVSIIMTQKLEWFDEIIITRPPVEAEYNMGYLPGNEEEKMDPYLRGFRGNLKFIINQKYPNKKDKDNLDFEHFNIKKESMSFMRGETTSRQIMIIDESQNSTLHAMKTALTRTGEDSIIIIMGDISQIDHHLLDALNNGLSHAIELMKDDDLASHVSLVKGERSELSERIAQKWDKHKL